MAKIELNSVTSGYNLSAINDNFQKIEEELKNKVLYVDEVSPMEQDLDMNGMNIINVDKVVAQQVQVGNAIITEGEFGPDSSAVLRGDLADSSVGKGASLVTLEDGRTLQEFADDYLGDFVFSQGDPTGAANSQLLIQNVLDTETGEIVFRNGTYRINGPIYPKSNQTLIFKNATLAMPNGTFLDGIVIDGVQNVRIVEAKIVGASGGNSFDRAILINNSTNITIEHCLIKDIGNEAVSPNEWGHGIEIGGNSSNVKILYNRINNVKGYGNLRGDGITVRASSNTLIEGNTVDTNRRMQIAVIDNATDVKIIGNHLLNGYLAGIDIEPNSVNTTGEITIQGNTIRNFGSKPGATTGVQYYGIDLHGSEIENITITGNIISAENSQAISCIHGMNNAKATTISGNILSCNGFAEGMTLFAGNGIKDLIIAENIIRDFALYGITGDKNGNVIIDGNMLESSQATVTHGIRMTSAVTDPTHVTITGNSIKTTSAINDGGIYLQAVKGFVVSDNRVSVSSGDAIEVYSNAEVIDGGVMGGNFVINTGTATNAYNLRAAGAGFIENTTFTGNMEKGFTNALSVTSQVSFAKDVLSTHLGFQSVGDTGVTLTSGVSSRVVVFNTPLTASRAVTLSATNAKKGDSFRIVRSTAATGAFNINIGTGPLRVLTAAGQWCDVTHDGSAWIVTGAGTL